MLIEAPEDSAQVAAAGGRDANMMHYDSHRNRFPMIFRGLPAAEITERVMQELLPADACPLCMAERLAPEFSTRPFDEVLSACIARWFFLRPICVLTGPQVAQTMIRLGRKSRERDGNVALRSKFPQVFRMGELPFLFGTAGFTRTRAIQFSGRLTGDLSWFSCWSVDSGSAVEVQMLNSDGFEGLPEITPEERTHIAALYAVSHRAAVSPQLMPSIEPLKFYLGEEFRAHLKAVTHVTSIQPLWSYSPFGTLIRKTSDGTKPQTKNSYHLQYRAHIPYAWEEGPDGLEVGALIDWIESQRMPGEMASTVRLPRLVEAQTENDTNIIILLSP